MDMDINLCKYRHILGVESQGIHSYRIFGFSLMDILMTFAGAYLLSYIFDTPYLWTLLGLFITGIVLHRIFCVRTTLDKLLFP